MTENKQNTLLWVIGGVLILLGIIYFSVSGREPGTVKFGVLTPLSGDNASYGMAVKRAYDLAVNEINSNGGINGKKIELLYEDSKCNGADATTATQKLIDSDGVRFILGGTCSGETLAAAPLAQEARVLLLSPSSTSPAITQAGDLVFRTYPSDNFEAKMVAEHATKNGYKRAAIISETTEFAQGVRDAFKADYTGTVVYDEMFNTGETDFSSFIAKMRSANPQMVYVSPQSPIAGELILKQINESGMNVAVYANNAMLDRSSIAKNSSIYEEIVMAEVQVPQDEKTSSMLSAYQSMYGSSPEFVAYTASAYDAIYMLVEAISAVGEDSQAVAGYLLYEIKDWPGTIGIFNFDENGDAQIELKLIQAIGGQLVPLEE